jgi:hypothetical protein
MNEHQHHKQAHSGHYKHLAIEAGIDFAIMYLVMYTMIDTLDHFHFNLNNLYMTLMMVAPMLLVMLFLMRSMFPDKKMNRAISAGVLIVFIASFIGMRTQAGVGDADFLRSMIPHHSGAILMCEEAAITDPQIIELCRTIIAGQSAEIAQMEQILENLN